MNNPENKFDNKDEHRKADSQCNEDSETLASIDNEGDKEVYNQSPDWRSIVDESKFSLEEARKRAEAFFKKYPERE